MWYCKYFGTKQEAEEYRKENGGYICWEERTPKRKLLTETGKEWQIAVRACGFDPEKAKYIVQKGV